MWVLSTGFDGVQAIVLRPAIVVGEPCDLDGSPLPVFAVPADRFPQLDRGGFPAEFDNLAAAAIAESVCGPVGDDLLEQSQLLILCSQLIQVVDHLRAP